MRRYIRHPSDIPISYCLEESNEKVQRLKDVSRGGLCFSADCPLRKGAPIHIEIPMEESSYGADGMVAWCREEGDHFEVGVKFRDNSTSYNVRMVEQVCHIEHYRSEIYSTQGRELSSEEAAKEWIEKFAEDFPSTN